MAAYWNCYISRFPAVYTTSFIASYKVATFFAFLEKYKEEEATRPFFKIAVETERKSDSFGIYVSKEWPWDSLPFRPSYRLLDTYTRRYSSTNYVLLAISWL